MEIPFKNIELFKWYDSETREPFFVYRKTPPDDIDTIFFSSELVGGFVMKGFNMKGSWDLNESDYRPNRRYRQVLLRYIFKSSDWLRHK